MITQGHHIVEDKEGYKPQSFNTWKRKENEVKKIEGRKSLFKEIILKEGIQ